MIIASKDKEHMLPNYYFYIRLGDIYHLIGGSKKEAY